MNHFAVGATKVPLHRRESHRNSIWAHLNSASVAKHECSRLHLSLGSLCTSRVSTAPSMAQEHPGCFSTTVVRLGGESHVSGMSKFFRTKS